MTLSVQAHDESALATGGRWAVGDLFHKYALALVWTGVLIFFSVLRPDTFATRSTLTTVLSTQSVLVVVTVGLLVPLTVGIFDLSFAATLGFATVTVAVLNVTYGWPIGFAILGGVAIGVIVGLINGFMAVVVGVDEVIATLAMSTVLLGASLGFSNFVHIGGVDSDLTNAARHPLFGVPLSFYYGIAFALLAWYVFRFTPLGRYLLVIGRNQDAARLTGLPVDRIRFGAFVSSGVTSALAGILLLGQFGAADPVGGNVYLLPAFAAAFLGTTAVAPSFFNVWGTIMAIYFLATTITGLYLIGISSWIEQSFYGGVLAVAVTAQKVIERNRAI